MRKSIVLGLAAATLLASGHARAFAEDVVALDGSVDNCLSIPTIPPALPGASGVCTTGIARRSTIHVDATYALAVALGFREDCAYFASAYSEVADEGSYAPFDTCGKKLTDAGKQIANVNFDGINRANTKKGGLAYHFMIPFAPNGTVPASVTGLYPFVGYEPYPTTFAVDRVYEGTLSQLRDTAMSFGASPLACSYAFTSPSKQTTTGLSFFSGNACWSGGTVTGIIPLTTSSPNGTWSAITGVQSLSSQPSFDYSSFQGTLDRATGELWLGSGGSGVNGKKVPAALARLGFYLHALQDRISHAYCGDSSFASASGSAFTYNYGTRACSNANHNTSHFYEVGQETGSDQKSPYALPLRDFTALLYTYNELKWFKELYKGSNAACFKDPWSEAPKEAVIGTSTTDEDGAITYVPSTDPRSVTAGLLKVGASARISQIASAVVAMGGAEMPGYGNAYVCPQ